MQGAEAGSTIREDATMIPKVSAYRYLSCVFPVITYSRCLVFLKSPAPTSEAAPAWMCSPGFRPFEAMTWATHRKPAMAEDAVMPGKAILTARVRARQSALPMFLMLVVPCADLGGYNTVSTSIWDNRVEQFWSALMEPLARRMSSRSSHIIDCDTNP